MWNCKTPRTKRRKALILALAMISRMWHQKYRQWKQISGTSSVYKILLSKRNNPQSEMPQCSLISKPLLREAGIKSTVDLISPCYFVTITLTFVFSQFICKIVRLLHLFYGGRNEGSEGHAVDPRWPKLRNWDAHQDLKSWVCPRTLPPHKAYTVSACFVTSFSRLGMLKWWTRNTA